MTQDLALFPTAPAHPHGEAVEAQVRPLAPLLDLWRWDTYEDGSLTLTLKLKGDGSTLRVWVMENAVEVDVFAAYAPYDVQVLTWVLMENHGAEFKARATRPERGTVPLYLTATYGLDDLAHLGEHIWDGFEAALTFRGRLWQVPLSEPEETLSA